MATKRKRVELGDEDERPPRWQTKRQRLVASAPPKKNNASSMQTDAFNEAAQQLMMESKEQLVARCKAHSPKVPGNRKDHKSKIVVRRASVLIVCCPCMRPLVPAAPDSLRWRVAQVNACCGVRSPSPHRAWLFGLFRSAQLNLLKADFPREVVRMRCLAARPVARAQRRLIEACARATSSLVASRDGFTGQLFFSHVLRVGPPRSRARTRYRRRL